MQGQVGTSMKTLVLCVDRDDDLGVKTGLKGPIIGRDDNLAAAMKLGLADPEDSDVNALLSAIAVYDDLARQGVDAEVATICGDVRVGSVSDLVLTQQLDRVLEGGRPDRAFLVSDGAEDEAFAPILGSRIRVDHVRRVFVRQTATVQSMYYQFAKQMKNPKGGRERLAPGRAPRHLFAVAGSFVALGLLVLGTAQSLQLFFGPLDAATTLPLIYLSIGLALAVVTATFLTDH